MSLIKVLFQKESINSTFVYYRMEMPEIIVKYKSAKALKAIQELTKAFDIVIENPMVKKAPKQGDDYSVLPITFSKNPDVTALAGIWEGRNITLEQLRKDAWGDRI